MANGLTFDPLGAFERGRQFRQAEALRPLELQQQQLGLQQTQQDLALGGLKQQDLQQQIDQRTEEQKNRDFVFSAIKVRSLPNDQKLAALRRNRQEILAKGGDTADTDLGIQLAQAGRFDELNQGLDQIVNLGRQQGIIKGGGLRTFAPQVGPTGQVGIPGIDPATGKTFFTPVPGLTKETPQQELQTTIEEERQKAEIAVGEAQETERVKLREKRTSDIKTELSERNRRTAREGAKIVQALTLATQSDQGLTAALKTQISRIFPGINTADEFALSAALNDLTVQQLQNFTGETTDFEFGVVQNIVGRLSDPRSANIARLKSLDRIRWFNQREVEEFDKFTKAGGDPDLFDFDIRETTMRIGKKNLRLADLLETAASNNMTMEEIIRTLRTELE